MWTAIIGKTAAGCREKYQLYLICIHTYQGRISKKGTSFSFPTVGVASQIQRGVYIYIYIYIFFFLIYLFIFFNYHKF